MIFCCAACGWAQKQSPTVRVASLAELQQQQAADDKDRTAYDKAQTLLDQNRYGEAAEAYRLLIASGSSRSDAAMYWRAYALSKLNRRSEALTQLSELQKKFPNSRWWTNDGAALLAQLDPKAVTSSPNKENEEMQLLAIQSLMNSDDERAFPLLEQVLKSPTKSERVKERALFVLAQSDDPRAQTAIQNIARGKENPALQCKAIEQIGIQGSKNSINALVAIYNSAADLKVKRCVLHAFMVSDAKENVLAVAKNEKDQSLRKEAIHQLGAMDAQQELRQMFQNAQTVEDKKAIIEACGISGDEELLSQVAKTSTEPEVRRAAIHGLGISDSKQGRATLLSMYGTEQNHEVKRSIVEALFIQDDAHDLIQMFKGENDPEMRRNIAEKLSVMDNKEARDFLLEVLNK
jgi:tetratricopeptide (TPR) repeat protein